MSESPLDPLFARLIVTVGYLMGCDEYEFAASALEAVERIYGKEATEQLQYAAMIWERRDAARAARDDR